MSNKIELVPIVPKQAEILAALHAEGFEQPWPANAFTSLLENPSRSGSLAIAGSAPLGFIMIQIVPDEAEILTLTVARQYRRQGVGQRLLEWAVAAAQSASCSRVLLEVAEANQAARALYEQVGFSQIGARSGYYAHSRGAQNALLLARSVVSPAPTR